MRGMRRDIDGVGEGGGFYRHRLGGGHAGLEVR